MKPTPLIIHNANLPKSGKTILAHIALTTMKPTRRIHPGFTTIEALSILLLITILALALIQPAMESNTYNKLTGAKTTPWDAIWVELRVEGQPNH